MQPESHDNVDILDYFDGFKAHENIKSLAIINPASDSTPVVSIMIPTFRRPLLLREAIESAINQNTNVPFEVVVVDNETDPAMAEQVDELVRSFGCKHLHLYRNEQNIGMFGNWNRCITLARGESLTILNDDDKLDYEYLDHVFRYKSEEHLTGVRSTIFGTPPETPGLIMKLRRIKEFISSVKSHSQLRLSDMMIGHPFLGSLGILYNKNKLKELGGFNERHWPISDYVLNTQYVIRFGGKILNKKLSYYRWEDNASKIHTTINGFITKGHQLRLDIITRQHPPLKKLLTQLNNAHTQIEANMTTLRIDKNYAPEQAVSNIGLDFKRLGIITTAASRIFIILPWKACCLLCTNAPNTIKTKTKATQIQPKK